MTLSETVGKFELCDWKSAIVTFPQRLFRNLSPTSFQSSILRWYFHCYVSMGKFHFIFQIPIKPPLHVYLIENHHILTFYLVNPPAPSHKIALYSYIVSLLSSSCHTVMPLPYHSGSSFNFIIYPLHYVSIVWYSYSYIVLS